MTTYTFLGVMTLATPMHITQAFTNDRISDEGRISSGTMGTPYSRTMRAPYLNEDGEATYLPMIPGNSLRGRLRRELGKLIRNQLVEDGKTIPMSVYHGLSCGTSTSSPSKAEKTVDLVHSAENDIYIGLMGGTPLMFAGKLRVGEGVPLVTEALDCGAIPVDLEDQALEVRRHTYPVSLIRKDDVLLFNDPQADVLIENYEEAVNEWQMSLLDNREKRRASREDASLAKQTAKNLKQMMAVELVPAGYKFLLEFTVKDPTEAQLGFLAMGLKGLLESPLGGYTRVGTGRFSAHLMLRKDDEFIGTVLTSQSNKVEMDFAGIETQVAAAKEAIKATDLALLDELFKVAA